MTDNPCLKRAVWGIYNLIHNQFFEKEIKETIQVDPLMLKEIFEYSKVGIQRIERALGILFDLNLCGRSGNDFIFEFRKIKNYEEISQRINSIECNNHYKIQTDLEYRP